MTLITGLRLAGLGHGEAMTRVAGGAGPLAVVQINAADTGVGPGGRINLAVVIDTG